MSTRRMLENQAITTAFMGNWHATKLLQIFQPIMEFSIHSIAVEKMMGVLEHCMTLMPSRGQAKKMVRMTGWNLMEEAKLLPPFDECLIPNHFLVMNIIAWNCRGPLKPSFQNHDPNIMIIMETCIGGNRARDITGRLPFNGHPHKNWEAPVQWATEPGTSLGGSRLIDLVIKNVRPNYFSKELLKYIFMKLDFINIW